MALSGVETLNPAMNKLSPDLGNEAHTVSKLYCSGDLSQYLCTVLNRGSLRVNLGFLAVLVLSVDRAHVF